MAQLPAFEGDDRDSRAVSRNQISIVVDVYHRQFCPAPEHRQELFNQDLAEVAARTAVHCEYGHFQAAEPDDADPMIRGCNDDRQRSRRRRASIMPPTKPHNPQTTDSTSALSNARAMPAAPTRPARGRPYAVNAARSRLPGWTVRFTRSPTCTVDSGGKSTVTDTSPPWPAKIPAPQPCPAAQRGHVVRGTRTVALLP